MSVYVDFEQHVRLLTALDIEVMDCGGERVAVRPMKSFVDEPWLALYKGDLDAFIKGLSGSYDSRAKAWEKGWNLFKLRNPYDV